MLDLPDEMILSILSYLTLSQTYNVRVCCKQLICLLEGNARIWKEILTRDFTITENQISSMNNLIPFVLTLDNYDKRFDENKYVSKRFLRENFFLKVTDIQQLPFNKVRSNRFVYQIYQIKDVIKLVCKIHIGITNFYMYSQKMLRIQNELMLIRKQKKEELKKQFYIWRINEDKKSLHLSSLSIKERRELLELTLDKMGIVIRNDSMLCKSFINGRCIKSLDEIKALMSMTYYLHSYSRNMFRYNHEKFKYSMESIMFRKRNSKNFKWMDAFFSVKKKYDKKFLFI
jgi:hypothetical protein